MRYNWHEEEINQTDMNYLVDGACVLFQNQGDYPVWVGKIKLLPADSFKIDIMPPHFVKQNMMILFENSAVPVSGSLRVVSGKKLIVSRLILAQE